MKVEQKVLEVLDAVEPELYWMLAKLIAAWIAFLLFKALVVNLVSYFLFSFNKQLGIGVHVKIRNHSGVIHFYNIRWIFIWTEDNGEIHIRTQKWREEKWMLLDPKRNRYKMIIQGAKDNVEKNKGTGGLDSGSADCRCHSGVVTGP